MISKIRNSVWLISMVVTELLVFNLCPKNNSFLSGLPALWIAPLSPLFSPILVVTVDRLQYKYFGVSKRKDAAYIFEQSIFANLVLTALMVVVMYTVYMHWKPLYVTMYITPWIILLGESVLLCALFYFNPEGKFVDVYAGKAFVIDNAAEKQEILTDANAIMRCLDDIEGRVECDRRLGHKHEDFYSVLEKLRENKYYLTEEEYKLILKRIDDCVSTSENGMVNYLEITMRLKQYWSEAKKYKSKCDTKPVS